MKTKDIRITLQSRGFERGVAEVLEAINEEMLQTRRDLRELAHLFDKLTDTLNGMMTVAGNMKDVIDKYNMREDPAHPELGPSTQGLDKQ